MTQTPSAGQAPSRYNKGIADACRELAPDVEEKNKRLIEVLLEVKLGTARAFVVLDYHEGEEYRNLVVYLNISGFSFQQWSIISCDLNFN